jgi:hypothetical protein
MGRKRITTEAHLRSIDPSGVMTSTIQSFVDNMRAGRCETILDPHSLLRDLSALSSTMAQLVSALAYRIEFDRQESELNALRAKVEE